MEQKKSWFTKLKEGLGKTNSWFAGLFGGERINEEFYDELEEAMILADMGMETAEKLLDELQLQFNYVRQGAITQEITEIVAGSGNGN